MCALPADEPFFPVACEVSQTVIDDLEVLLLKPKLALDASAEQSLLVVSTMRQPELKENVNTRLNSIFAQVPKKSVLKRTCQYRWVCCQASGALLKERRMERGCAAK